MGRRKPTIGEAGRSRTAAASSWHMTPVVARPTPLHLAVFSAAVALALAVLGALAPAVLAKDRIYFSNAGPLAYTNLDGTGTGNYVELVEPTGYSPAFTGGLALDPAADRFYVAAPGPGGPFEGILAGSLGDLGDDQATVTPIATGGATVDVPFGATIDPATERIYWANLGGWSSPGGGIQPGAISYASLDGSDSGDLNTSGATLDQPFGVALDRAAGRIYWGNYNGDTISYANLDGSGGGDLDTSGATVLGVRGVALDPAENRIYWANAPEGTIAFANLDGTGGGGELDVPGFPGGLFPVFPVLLKEPSATKRPEISGASGQSGASASGKDVVGRKLSCSEGRWAADLLGGFNYRAPRSFAYRWLRDGAKISGATTKGFTPRKAGSYRCRVKASNEAGSSSQKSRAVEIASPSACEKAKKKLKKAKRKLSKAKKAGNKTAARKAKRKLKKAKKAMKKAC